MATEAPVFVVPGMLAGADLSADQFKLVKQNGTGKQVILCSSAGEFVFGVLQNKPDAVAKAATIQTLGMSKVLAGASVSIGDQLKCDATGRAVAASAANVDATSASTTEAVKGSFVFGVALEAASAAGEVISVDLRPSALIPGTTE